MGGGLPQAQVRRAALTLSAYIHLNPVRAKMVADPAEYRWSSFAGYERPVRQFKFVTEDRILRLYDGLSREQQRIRYTAYVRRGVETPPECPWANAWKGMVMGGAGYVEKIKAQLGLEAPKAGIPLSRHAVIRPSLETIRDGVAKSLGEDAQQWRPGVRFRSPGRAIAAYLSYRVFGYGQGEIAALLGYSGWSGVNQGMNRVAKDKALLKKANGWADAWRAKQAKK